MCDMLLLQLLGTGNQTSTAKVCFLAYVTAVWFCRILLTFDYFILLSCFHFYFSSISCYCLYQILLKICMDLK